MDLHAWAKRHGVSDMAVAELRMLLLGGVPLPAEAPVAASNGSEASQQNLIRLAAPGFGVWLTRNNVGVLMDKTGRPVRYGLANETPQQNQTIKSGDLIGIQSFVVTPEHVGQTIGRFVSVECKARGWKYSGNAHERAQRNWAEFVIGKGGLAIFASEPHHLNHLGVQKHE